MSQLRIRLRTLMAIVAALTLLVCAVPVSGFTASGSEQTTEEALETVIEATNGTDDHLVYEASDLLYHLIVLLTEKGLRIEDVANELHKRHDPNWDKQRREAKAAGKMK